MKTLKLILLSFFFSFNQFVSSQEFIIPDVKYETEDDYSKYQDDVLNAIEWMENTNYQYNPEKRKRVNKFLLKWMFGTPTVSIPIFNFHRELTKKNPELITIMLGGFTKYALNSKSQEIDNIAAHVESIKSLIKVYSTNKGNGIKKDRKIEKLTKLNSDGLREWIIKQLE